MLQHGILCHIIACHSIANHLLLYLLDDNLSNYYASFLRSSTMQNRLHLVLVNFLSNAIKFSVMGSVVTIEVGSALKCVSRKISEFSTGKFFSLRRNSENKKKRFSFQGKSSKIQQSPRRDSKSVRDCQIRYVTVLVNDLGVGIHEDDQGDKYPLI